MYVYFQGVFYAIVIYGLTVLRVCYGPLPVFLCNIAGFLKACAVTFGAIIIAIYTFTRFMFVCIWKRMRQMNDNLIVGITTIQAIFMSLLFPAATWLQIQRQPTPPVSFFLQCKSKTFGKIAPVNKALLFWYWKRLKKYFFRNKTLCFSR